MRSRDVLDLLAAPGPFSGYAEKAMLYGQFVGSWDVEATWHDGGATWELVQEMRARRRG